MTFLILTDWVDDKQITVNANQVVYFKRLTDKTELFFIGGDSLYIVEKPTEILELLSRKTKFSAPQLDIFDSLEPVTRERHV